MSLQVGRIHHQHLGILAFAGQRGQDAGEDPHSAPADPAVIIAFSRVGYRLIRVDDLTANKPLDSVPDAGAGGCRGQQVSAVIARDVSADAIPARSFSPPRSARHDVGCSAAGRERDADQLEERQPAMR